MHHLKKIKDCFNPKIHHFRFTQSDSHYQGVGSDYNSEIAKEKAISEFLETNVARELDLPFTTGIAVHTSEELSTRNSKLELTERHYFFKSWFSGLHPEWIENFKLNNKYSIHLGLIAKNDDIYVTAGILRSSRNIGFMLLLAAENSFNDCRNKLFLDSHRMMTLIEQSDLTNLRSLSIFTSPIDHAIHYLNPSNYNLSFIEEYCSTSNSALIIEKNFKFHTITSKHDFYGTRFASFSSCEDFISYFVGTPEHLVVKFQKKIPQNRWIHPIG